MLTHFLRYRDLEDKGIVRSWAALRYKIKHNGFPTGRYIGPNSRAWTVEEVQAWIDALPSEKPATKARAEHEAA